ncbi:MAG: hypothetical protein LQ340_007997 [Diploschistes diacapsis]|nr:MAG: hypothetical protein LQ340_007997 [Diploschistes diacapsis]
MLRRLALVGSRTAPSALAAGIREGVAAEELGLEIAPVSGFVGLCGRKLLEDVGGREGIMD